MHGRFESGCESAFFTAQNLDERVENASHLWKDQGTCKIGIAIIRLSSDLAL